MPFNITEFRGQMKFDGARPNLFEVRLAFPSVAGAGDAQSRISFFCRSAQLPGSTVGTVIVPYFGRETKFAGNRQFQDWTLQVLNDEDFTIRNGFEKWMNALNTHVTNLRNPAALSTFAYSTDAEVIQYGKGGNKIKVYKFKGCFPVDLSPIDVSWDANDQIEEYSVTLAFQYWESQGTTN